MLICGSLYISGHRLLKQKTAGKLEDPRENVSSVSPQFLFFTDYRGLKFIETANRLVF